MCTITVSGTSRVMGAKFQMASMPEETIRSATRCASSAGTQMIAELNVHPPAQRLEFSKRQHGLFVDHGADYGFVHVKGGGDADVVVPEPLVVQQRPAQASPRRPKNISVLLL